MTKGLAVLVVFISTLLSLDAQPRLPVRELPTPPRMEVPPAPEFLWDRKTASHLIRRAGFGASLDEVDRIVAQGFEAALNELLYFEQMDNSAMEATLAAQNYPLVRLDNNNRELTNVLGIRQWWLYRMIHSRHQLVEKMAFFWHDHFATAVVGGTRFVNANKRPLMLVQNDRFRSDALGNFKQMVHEIARDPAMLFWLDNRSNRKGNPNENWARELLELFTMGEGNYSEEDVREAARAFTGWTLTGGPAKSDNPYSFIFRPNQHDYDMKSFLGVSGNLDGDDIIDIIFQQEVTAEFIARKLFEYFAYPDPSEEIVSELAGIFRDSGYETRALMEAIFRHPEFFSTDAYRAHIKNPVEFVVGVSRALGLTDPGPLPRQMTLLGQDLFSPPDVGGWTSGVGWINTSTILARYNFLNAVITPAREQDRQRLDLETTISTHGLSTGYAALTYFLDSLVQSDISFDTRYSLEQYLYTDDGIPVEFDITDPAAVDEKLRGLIYLISTLPVYQLN
ncbi:MAG: DUF1800 domain-containing protein [Acidobacteriota bacterium]